ncbi:hypothetical protein K1719_017270 [Acacia pycnantha]|nr:hypothetical protein K1719_017270 [Acacia pycnantha]
MASPLKSSIRPYNRCCISCTFIFHSPFQLRGAMATIFDAIHVLTPKRHNWRICVCVVLMWNMPAWQGPGDAFSMELVMYGDSVDASVRSGFVRCHKKHLEEAIAVEVSNFIVVPATGWYKPT